MMAKIPRRGAAATEGAQDDGEQQEGAEGAAQDEGATKAPETAPAQAGSPTTQTVTAASVENAFKDTAPPPAAKPADTQKDMELIRAYQKGAELIVSGRMTPAEAVREVTATFGVSAAVATAVLDAGVNKLRTEQALASGDFVMAEVVKAYRLTVTPTDVREFRPGVQSMPRILAEHWYSKAMGVSIVGE